MNPSATTSVYVTDPLGASDCDPGPSGALPGRRCWKRNIHAIFRALLLPFSKQKCTISPSPHPSAQCLSTAGRAQVERKADSLRPGSTERGWSKHSHPRLRGQSDGQRLPERPPGRGHASSSSPRSPHSFVPGVRGAEKRKEELSELQEGALQAPQRGGGAGVETKKERKEGARSSQRKGTRAHARKGHDSPGTRLHPGSSKRTGALGLRGAPPRAEDEEAR